MRAAHPLMLDLITKLRDGQSAMGPVFQNCFAIQFMPPFRVIHVRIIPIHNNPDETSYFFHLSLAPDKQSYLVHNQDQRIPNLQFRNAHTLIHYLIEFAQGRHIPGPP